MRFASPEWIDAVASALNAHPDLARALAGLGRDAAFVVEAERPAFPRSLAVHAEQERGRVAAGGCSPTRTTSSSSSPPT